MNTVTITCSATSVEVPQTCETLGAIFGHPIAAMRAGSGRVELDFPDDWEPDEQDCALIREAIETGYVI